MFKKNGKSYNDVPKGKRTYARISEVKFLFLAPVYRDKQYKLERKHAMDYQLLNGFIYAKIENVDFSKDPKRILPIMKECYNFAKTLPHYKDRFLPKPKLLENLKEFVRKFKQ